MGHSRLWTQPYSQGCRGTMYPSAGRYLGAGRGHLINRLPSGSDERERWCGPKAPPLTLLSSPAPHRITSSTWRWHPGQRGSYHRPSCPTSPGAVWPRGSRSWVPTLEWGQALTAWPWTSSFRDLSFLVCRLGVMIVAASSVYCEDLLREFIEST